MLLKDRRILLTGATGGLGSALAVELAKAGAKLGLVDTEYDQLGELYDKIQPLTDAITCLSDITELRAQQNIVHDMYSAFGGTDILINNAGIKEFVEYTEQKPAMIDRLLHVNVIAPMQLTRLLLPEMLSRESGQIVNIGSPFGSTASAFFTAYSASKFALRGFSEALRRELSPTNVNVTYISPRGIDTAIHGQAIFNMAKAARLKMDTPEKVARKIVKAIIKEKKEVYIGFNQSLACRINGLIPRLTDIFISRRTRIMRQYTHHP